MAHQMLERFVVHRRSAPKQLSKLDQTTHATELVRADESSVELLRQQRLRQIAYEGLEQRRHHVHILPAGVGQCHLVQPTIDRLRQLRNGGGIARDAIDADHAQPFRLDDAGALAEYQRNVWVFLGHGAQLERSSSRSEPGSAEEDELRIAADPALPTFPPVLANPMEARPEALCVRSSSKSKKRNNSLATNYYWCGSLLYKFIRSKPSGDSARPDSKSFVFSETPCTPCDGRGRLATLNVPAIGDERAGIAATVSDGGADFGGGCIVSQRLSAATEGPMKNCSLIEDSCDAWQVRRERFLRFLVHHRHRELRDAGLSLRALIRFGVVCGFTEELQAKEG
uniref:Uncharacterized protein n=1 Tax=Anopheles atroparvus TaxID=41427 RepID=A0A182ISH0_ANOAO